MILEGALISAAMAEVDGRSLFINSLSQQVLGHTYLTLRSLSSTIFYDFEHFFQKTVFFFQYKNNGIYMENQKALVRLT